MIIKIFLFFIFFFFLSSPLNFHNLSRGIAGRLVMVA